MLYCKLLMIKENRKLSFPSSFKLNIFSKSIKMLDIYQLFQRPSHTFMCSKSMYTTVVPAIKQLFICRKGSKCLIPV